MKNVSRLERLLTVGAKPYRILIVIMNNNAFFELCFMVTVTYHFAEIATGSWQYSALSP